MDEHADTANVALPTAELLMESSIGHDLTFGNREQRKVPAKVDILAPVMNHFRFGYAVLDEHPFVGRDREEQFVEGGFIGLFQRTHVAPKPPFELDGLRVLVQYVFKRHEREEHDRRQTEASSIGVIGVED